MKLPYLHHTVVLKETGLEVLSDPGAGSGVFLLILVIFRHRAEFTLTQISPLLLNLQAQESAS